MVCIIISVDDDIDVKPNSADFALFDDLKKKVDLGLEANIAQYQPVRATENPYEIQ